MYDEYDRLEARVNAARRYAEHVAMRLREGTLTPESELDLMVEATQDDAAAVRSSNLAQIDRDELLAPLRGVEAWLHFVRAYQDAAVSLTRPSVDRILTTALDERPEGEGFFLDAMVVFARGRRTARLWDAARVVGEDIRDAKRADPHSETLKALWDVHQFLFPDLLREYREPAPARGPNVVKSVTSAGLPGLGRRR